MPATVVKPDGVSGIDLSGLPTRSTVWPLNPKVSLIVGATSPISNWTSEVSNIQ